MDRTERITATNWHLTVDDLDKSQLDYVEDLLKFFGAPKKNTKQFVEAVLSEFRTQPNMRLGVLRDVLWCGAPIPDKWENKLEKLLSQLTQMDISKRIAPNTWRHSGLIPFFAIRESEA